MINTSANNIDNSSKTSLYVSIGIFVFVLIISIGLYFYNSYLYKKVDNIRSEISLVEENIKKINEDEKVKLYTLVKSNGIFLDRYKYISNIPEYINNLVVLSKKYNISFHGFNYSAGELSTEVLALNDAISLAYFKTKNFLEYFRKKDENIFSLGFVDSFIGQENIKFSVKFKIK